ncbi:MAG: SDR family oxidoreductase [Burkholderiaceae bacterium]
MKTVQDRQPGIESEMDPKPDFEPRHPGSGRLKDKRVLVTGGDSGIGRAVAVLFAREGARLAIVYKDENDDAEHTRELVEREGSTAQLIRGDIGDPAFCERAVSQAVSELGGLDVVISNAAEQHACAEFEDIGNEQLQRTYRTNLFGTFYVLQAAVPHLESGASIVCTTSITAYRGQDLLIDYASTKGAVLSLVRALASKFAERGIRVNGVAPGPIWTPLIPASFPPDVVENFGKGTPLGRPGQPWEVAPSFLFLASDDANYMTGQVLHPNGGSPVAG